ncbi:MAG: hypothetical protein WCQ99_02120 [Pseudomonadota bacterium]
MCKKNIIALMTFCFFVSYAPAFAAYDAAYPGTISSLTSMTYSYNPVTKILTKAYNLKNNSLNTIVSPRLVNLFLWSNSLCSDPLTAWSTMSYNGTGIYSNTDQTATVANNDGTINWSSQVSPAAFVSTQLFSGITPFQTVQGGVNYPYWNIKPLSWSPGEEVTINVQFSNVEKCNWIQNVVWIVCSVDGTPPVTTTTTTVEPTLIKLSDFQAIPGNKEVKLVWHTESEIDTAGFNIYRSEGLSKETVKINTALIPAKGSATSGADYTFTDSDVKNTVPYIYKLEDIETNGEATLHKPALATPRFIYSIINK